MGTLALLLQVAFRNLFKSWINLVIGFVIFFATLLVVFGGAFLDSLDSSLSRSIVGSVAGHLQVYSDRSKEELALFGGNMGEDPNVSPVERFDVLRAAVSKHPNVKQVVPMGVSSAIVTSGNAVDHALEQLRALYRQQAEGQAAPDAAARIASLKSHVRRLADLMKAEQATQKEMLREGARDPSEAEALTRAQSDAFWADFDKDPLANLEFLENRLAPQAAEGEMVPFRYIGTDPGAFQQSFDRMEIVEGQAIPEGERGIVLAKLFYEDAFKLKSARRLDKIKEGLETGRTLAADPELQRLQRENVNQLREIQYQLDPLKAAEATRRLQRVLGSAEQDLGKLLEAFFKTDDQNFQERYRQYYAELAPMLQLYRVKPGEMLTLSSLGQSGYVQSSNVRVWGTFRFKGMEKSPMAGFINVMDLVTFRELYGQPTAETRKEIQALKASAGAREVKREDAEADLFGGAAGLVSEAGGGVVDADALLPAGERARTPAITTYAPQEIEQGMVLSAAVTLKDPGQLQRTLEELREAPAVKAAGLRVIDWQKAAGNLGQLVLMFRMALWVIIAILAVVVLAVINNAMMMATLRRTREIGTLRAIGAQRAFVLAMVLVETMVLSLVFGLAGMGAGSLLVNVVNSAGIPATSDEMQFFFSGPRLDLFVSPTSLVAAFVMVVVVTAISTLYPAVQATRISPVTAMQSEE
jgi:ABC-type lipoprotein release transport system permease subunit